MDQYNRLLYKVEHAKPLEFNDIFSNVIELFKKVWLKGFLMVLILVGFTLGVNMVFSIIGLAPNVLFFRGEEQSLTWFFIYSILQGIPQTILVSTLTLALVSAFYRMCIQYDANAPAVDDYFYFLKKEYFSKLFMLGIIYTGIATVAQLMLFIPYIYVAVPLGYIAIVFVNNPELSEMEIVKASFKLGNKKWLISFGTLLVAGFLGFLGVLACGIGVLFTISIVYLPTFVIYKEVVGFGVENEIEQIGSENLDN